MNDARRLSQDPTFRLIGSEKVWERGAALTSRLHWFETEVLTQEENLDGLAKINRELRRPIPPQLNEVRTKVISTDRFRARRDDRHAQETQPPGRVLLFVEKPAPIGRLRPSDLPCRRNLVVRRHGACI